ncbi:unnamed protein product [Echinostoma caproni]|uniref:Uncharacterized protein n=1 Tax=Echinostoma caproni TaxID=27848 RepID=A0A183B070_9TREM|nr:unnamed protein product [Echinostoma caproni]
MDDQRPDRHALRQLALGYLTDPSSVSVPPPPPLSAQVGPNLPNGPTVRPYTAEMNSNQILNTIDHPPVVIHPASSSPPRDAYSTEVSSHRDSHL